MWKELDYGRPKEYGSIKIYNPPREDGRGQVDQEVPSKWVENHTKNPPNYSWLRNIWPADTVSALFMHPCVAYPRKWAFRGELHWVGEFRSHGAFMDTMTKHTRHLWWWLQWIKHWTLLGALQTYSLTYVLRWYNMHNLLGKIQFSFFGFFSWITEYFRWKFLNFLWKVLSLSSISNIVHKVYRKLVQVVFKKAEQIPFFTQDYT